jgi:hypothetical protein
MSTKPPGRVRRTYEFIKAHRQKHRVQVMCRLLGVAPIGYYAWLAQPVSDHGQEDARLLRLIRASFTASQGIYGAPRVFLDLREAGETCSKHRVARLMREHQLRALHGYRMRRWSVGKPSVLIPNLLKRQFTVTRRNKAHSDVAGLALPGRRPGPVLAQDRRLVGQADDSSGARPRRGSDGRTPATSARHPDSFGSRHAVWQRRLAALLPQPSSRTEHEPQGQLLGYSVHDSAASRRNGSRSRFTRTEHWRSTTWPITSIASTIEPVATVISAA